MIKSINELTPPNLDNMALLADVQAYEPYGSAALNRQLRGVLSKGVYSGFNVVPATGLKVNVTSADIYSAAAVEVSDKWLITVRQQSDVLLNIPAGRVSTVVLKAFYDGKTITNQVDVDSTIKASELLVVNAGSEPADSLILCQINVPSNASSITPAMISYDKRDRVSLEGFWNKLDSEHIAPKGQWFRTILNKGIKPSLDNVRAAAVDTVGTADSWFQEVWANKYRGGSIDVEGTIRSGGKLAMLQGDFGIGSTSKVLAANSDLNSLPLENGKYRGTGLLNTPEGATASSGWWFVDHECHSLEHQVQRAIKYAATGHYGVWYRVKLNGTWQPWDCLYSVNNKPTKSDVGLSNVANERQYSAQNNNIGTSPTNYAAGDHKHDDLYSKLGHKHVWSDITNPPEQATRWPTLAEIGAQPAGSYAAASHTHPWSQITGAPVYTTRWPSWSEVSGRPATMPPDPHAHVELSYLDTRGVNYNPDTIPSNLKMTFQSNGTNGVSDGGSYYSLLHLPRYGDGSGGYGNQLIFTDNGNMWMRKGLSNTAWSEWAKIYTSQSKPTLGELGAAPASHSHATISTNYTNWVGNSEAAIVGGLAWRNYGNNHVIFDASNSRTPAGTVCDNSNPQHGWAATYPSLMGFDGAKTYGLKVDRARLAETLNGLDVHYDRNSEANKVVRTDANGYLQIGWLNTLSGATASGTLFACFNNTSDMYLRYMNAEQTRNAIGAQPAGSYAAASHTHPWAQITGIPEQATRWPNATEVGLGNVPNTPHSYEAYAGHVPIRDGAGDITSRLFRAEFANDSFLNGAIAFRTAGGAGTDNYIRFCSNPDAVRNWIGAAPASHSHPWSQITGAPVYTTRWPTLAEIGAAAASHTHSLSQVTGISLSGVAGSKRLVFTHDGYNVGTVQNLTYGEVQGKMITIIGISNDYLITGTVYAPLINDLPPTGRNKVVFGFYSTGGIQFDASSTAGKLIPLDMHLRRIYIHD